MTALPTREQIERAAPLGFDAPRQEKQANITIEGMLDGLTVTVEFTSAISAIPAAIERLKAIGLSSAQRSMAPAAPATPKAKAETVEPLYKPDGTACCPIHMRPLVEGSYGLYCSSKAQPGQAANAKGYCSLRFDS